MIDELAQQVTALPCCLLARNM